MASTRCFWGRSLVHELSLFGDLEGSPVPRSGSARAPVHRPLVEPPGSHITESGSEEAAQWLQPESPRLRPGASGSEETEGEGGEDEGSPAGALQSSGSRVGVVGAGPLSPTQAGCHKVWQGS